MRVAYADNRRTLLSEAGCRPESRDLRVPLVQGKRGVTPETAWLLAGASGQPTPLSMAKVSDDGTPRIGGFPGS